VVRFDIEKILTVALHHFHPPFAFMFASADLVAMRGATLSFYRCE
jgi:hypothetical protein